MVQKAGVQHDLVGDMTMDVNADAVLRMAKIPHNATSASTEALQSAIRAYAQLMHERFSIALEYTKREFEVIVRAARNQAPHELRDILWCRYRRKMTHQKPEMPCVSPATQLPSLSQGRTTSHASLQLAAATTALRQPYRSTLKLTYSSPTDTL